MIFSKRLVLLCYLLVLSCNGNIENTLVLKDANIINTYNGQITKKSILIHNDIIVEIGDYESWTVRNGTKVIDCNEKYLLPGFFDMHTHILEHKNSTQFLDSLLAVGITSIRDMGGHTDSIAQIKSNIYKGVIKGPNIYFAGYTLDGYKQKDSPDPTTIVINDSTNLNDIVSMLDRFKVNFIKVHSYFPQNRLEELIEISSQYDLSVVGHIPLKIDPEEAIEMGMKSIEHINSIIQGLVTKESNGIENITQAFYAIDSTYLNSLSKTFIKYETAFTPTLHIINKTYESNSDENLQRLGKLMMDRFLPMVLTLNNNGILILAGSDDVPIDEKNYMSLHKELKWLVKAGLTNLESIQAATINPAKFLKVESEYGSIDKNKKADIIILNSNPLDDISNTMDISNTIVNGKSFD